MFIEEPASKQSLSRRKLIFGIGVNDAEYITSPRFGDIRGVCPYYSRWRSMLARCYSKKRQETSVAYKGCTVCKEWFVFSNFRCWMMAQDWEGRELDKDIKFDGNKVYSPETCLFVSQKENREKSQAKNYKLIDPEGQVVEVYNLNQFCKVNGLNQGNMNEVCLGHRNQHKGWKFAS